MKRTQLACKPCKDIKAKCDNFQPCTRCLQSNLADQCIRLRVARGPRKRSSIACVACKRSKLRCDEERPCSRCKRLGRELDCIDEELQLIPAQFVEPDDHQLCVYEMLPADRSDHLQGLQVERPLNFRVRSLSFEEPCHMRERMNSMGWPDRVLSRHFEFGHSSKDMMNIFVSLPPQVQHITRRALQALEVIVEDMAAKKQAQAVAEHLLTDNLTCSKQEIELESSFYEQQNFGVMSQHVYPWTGKRAHAYLSSSVCKMMGLHAEEALARLANRELPLLSTEFNYYFYVMFGTWSFAMHPGRPLDLMTPICVRGEHGDSCMMVRVVQQQEFDCQGSLKAIKSFLIPLSREEYETRVKDPNDTFVRLMKVLNQNRSYDMWLKDFEVDMYAGETILGLQKSRQGEERLQRLAKELEILYRPFVVKAEQILTAREMSKNRGHDH